MDYIIISYEFKSSYDAKKAVQEDVKERMKYGYEPLGGVSVAISEVGYAYHYTFSQAMIKK